MKRSEPAGIHDSDPGQEWKSRQTLVLAMSAIGVVFGDLGTSPLYALRECFHGSHAIVPTGANILGVLSLIFWSLIVVVSVKYTLFILRADNQGEGGTFALLALLLSAKGRISAPVRSTAIVAGMIGAGLLFGDGVITPAISVLSAIEGLETAEREASPLILPITCTVLVLLFLLQKRGTARIGTLFGPVMVLWFAAIALFGLRQVLLAPQVLLAVNPAHAVAFFVFNKIHGIVVLGSVVLCVTGCEALYADLGHFGKKAIRLSWLGFICPALLLNYFGQGAFLLGHPELNANPFYGIVPRSLLYPMVGLATVATVIASQALISGVFSLMQQAMQLGFCPRMRIVHTSAKIRGQIYIPFINYVLMIACVGVVIGFDGSSGLAGAYGIAVTGTMTITSVLYLLVIVKVWRWSLAKALSLVGIFLIFDMAYLVGNFFKIAHGGWLTLLIAAMITLVMTTWKRGREELGRRLSGTHVPLDVLLSDLVGRDLPRVPGTAVFLSISPVGAPRTLLNHIKHNRMLHDKVVILSIMFADRPTVPVRERIRLDDLGAGFYRVAASFGFRQRPNVPEIVKMISRRGLTIDPAATTYYLGRETLLTGGKSRMMRWRKSLFAFMSRNAGNPTAYFSLPLNRVVEFGVQVEL